MWYYRYMNETNTSVDGAVATEEKPLQPTATTTPEAPASGGAAVEQSVATEVRASVNTETIDPETFGIDPELLASVAEADEQAAAPQDEAPAATPGPQEQTPADLPTPPAAEPVVAQQVDDSDLPAIPTGEGYPSMEPEPGTDVWGNLVYGGKSYVSVPNPAGGPPQLFEADPQTGMIALSHDELSQMRGDNPDDYLAYVQQAEIRRSRLGEVLTASTAREEVVIKKAMLGSGISNEVFTLLDTEARNILKPVGAQAKAPGYYSQALQLAIGKAFTEGGATADAIVKAYTAMQSGQPAQPTAAPVAQPAAPAPRQPAVRLPTGVAHAAAPPSAAPRANAQVATVDPKLSPFLSHANLTNEDFTQYGGDLIVD